MAEEANDSTHLFKIFPLIVTAKKRSSSETVKFEVSSDVELSAKCVEFALQGYQIDTVVTSSGQSLYNNAELRRKEYDEYIKIIEAQQTYKRFSQKFYRDEWIAERIKKGKYK